MKLILTRHGETVENAAGIIQGHLEGKLNETGKTQARKLAQRLQDEKIDVLYSSDLNRAVETSQEILKFHPKIPVTITKELRERKHGIFEGRKRSEIDASETESALFQSITIPPKNGESWLQVYQRAQRFLQGIIPKHTNQTVLLVSHGGLVRTLTCLLKNKSPEEVFTTEKITNTSLTIFELKENQPAQLLLHNCTKHLKPC